MENENKIENEKKEYSKRTIVLGTGKSGISAAKLLLLSNVKVLLYNSEDETDVNKIKEQFDDIRNIEIKKGILTQEDLENVELCIISPGISPEKDFVKLINELEIPIWSELELGYRFCKGNICAVTGSNGKTTTTKLLGEILKKEFDDVHVCGNIGNPLCNDALKTDDKSYTAIEVSSFQLDDIVEFRPDVACITNFSPDHLDRYKKYENYINSKLRISMNQTEHDVIVLNYDDTIIKSLIKNDLFKAKQVFISSKTEISEGFYYKKDAIYFKDAGEAKKILDVKDVQLVGVHNYENIMSAMACAYYMGVSMDTIVEVCKEFKPVEHRIEFVRERSGVKFYNDSKATNPDSAIKGLLAMNGKTVLIAGGYDKGANYLDWVKLFSGRLNRLILIGATKKDIAHACTLVHFDDYTYAQDLKEAVKLAASFANMGENVLFSPACASWDMFDNYEQRGKIFKEEVRAL